MKRIKFAGSVRKKAFRYSTLYETLDDTADPVKLILSFNKIVLSIAITGAVFLTSVTLGHSGVVVFDDATTVFP